MFIFCTKRQKNNAMFKAAALPLHINILTRRFVGVDLVVLPTAFNFARNFPRKYRFNNRFNK